MSWVQQLYETYQVSIGREPEGSGKILPLFHTTVQAHIEVVLDRHGTFRRAQVVPRDDSRTVIPVTEDSGGRSGKKPVPHPLCDKLQYLAGDFVEFGGTVTIGFSGNPQEPFDRYVEALGHWSNSEFRHLRLAAVLSYVLKRTLIHDLVAEKVLATDSDRRLLTKWVRSKEGKPALFAVLGSTSQHESVVRWCVEGEIGDPVSATWLDPSLHSSWIGYYLSQPSEKSFCMVTGEVERPAKNHPKKVRHERDQGKLLSSNDTSGYTFRGRFAQAEEAASVSLEASQKAHNALKWLIARQAYCDDKQVFLAWSPTGAKLPNPTESTLALFAEDLARSALQVDTAEAFAHRLRLKIAGYRAELDDRADVVLLGLDSATEGRIAITYHRTLLGSEFLDRIQRWHEQLAWYQFVGQPPRYFVGAPAPVEIASAAYGRRLDKRLTRATIERLMPCIIEGMPVPRDLVESVVRRASMGPVASGDGSKLREARQVWRQTIGVACSLYRGSHAERNYAMSLETDRTTRDYLYGRLLAIADNIERFALDKAEENRITSAERLIRRFADHPFTTWRTIELDLRPYMARVQVSSPGFLASRIRLLGEVKDAFTSDDFIDDRPLTGEFLLSYDVQRRALTRKRESAEAVGSESDSEHGDVEG